MPEHGKGAGQFFAEMLAERFRSVPLALLVFVSLVFVVLIVISIYFFVVLPELGFILLMMTAFIFTAFVFAIQNRLKARKEARERTGGER